MASLKVGMVRSYKHEKVVILRTGLSIKDSDAVRVAPLSPRRPSGSGRHVEAKVGKLLDSARPGKRRPDRRHGPRRLGGPDRLSNELLDPLLKAMSRPAPPETT